MICKALERVKLIKKVLGLTAEIHGRNFEILNCNRNKMKGTDCRYLTTFVDWLDVKNEGEERGSPVS